MAAPPSTTREPLGNMKSFCKYKPNPIKMKNFKSLFVKRYNRIWGKFLGGAQKEESNQVKGKSSPKEMWCVESTWVNPKLNRRKGSTCMSITKRAVFFHLLAIFPLLLFSQTMMQTNRAPSG